MFEMLAGRTPFAGDSIPETLANLISREPPPLSRYNENLPGELQRMISKMLCKEKELRYQTISGLLAELKDFLENLKLEKALNRAAGTDRQNTAQIPVRAFLITTISFVLDGYDKLLADAKG